MAPPGATSNTSTMRLMAFGMKAVMVLGGVAAGVAIVAAYLLG
jgi:hypothetical protein